MRLCACFGLTLDLIGPLSFALSDRKLKRSGMDYVDLASYVLHDDFQAFDRVRTGRLIAVTPGGDVTYDRFQFAPDDTLLLGRESCGLPDGVVARCDGGVRIPMVPSVRSINVALAGAIVLGEAMRQTNLLPDRAGA